VCAQKIDSRVRLRATDERATGRPVCHVMSSGEVYVSPIADLQIA